MSALFPQMLLDTHDELIIDLFAGGGGASSGIEQALGRQVDVAINHDSAAVSLHERNHPQTKHYTSDVFEVDPRAVTQGRPIGLLWASPDCTFHSKARGGKPIRSKTKKRRALAWVVTRWAGQVRPRVIMLENVEEFAQWGPLVGAPDQLRPCPRRRGRTFRKWVKSLERYEYKVEWREMRACDYGAPTIRKRLFLIARCDGLPIVWPEPTHGDPKCEAVKSGRLKPFRTAAECIDWRIPMLSIFATKEEAKQWGKDHGQASPIRPLAENTNKRIARGVKRYVVDNPKPFLVTLAHGEESPNGSKRWGNGIRDVDQPHTTVACSNDTAVVAPVIIPRYGEREGQEPRCRSVEEPSPVVVPDGNGGSLCAAHLSTYYGSKDGAERVADLNEPLRVQTTENRHAVIAVNLCTNNNSRDPLYGADEPANTIVSDGARHNVVASFLGQYNGGFAEGNSGDGHELDEPSSTISTKGPHQALVAGFLDQCNNGFDNRVGSSLDDPKNAVCAQGSQQSLVAASLIEQHGTAHGEDIEKPLQTISAGGTHHGVVAAHIQRDFGQSVGHPADVPLGTVTPEGQGKASVVASFMAKYYGQGIGQELTDPVHTIPTVDRFACVNVYINGQRYVIEDIKMRMLQPRELYRAQGFRDGYVIDEGADGRRLTKTEQVRMCGNSVSPPLAEALAGANAAHLVVRKASAPRSKRSTQAVAA